MQITWFGHSAFRLDFAGQAVLIDPFFTGNPAFVSDKAAASKDVKHIVLTHGHGDHVGDALDIANSNGATVTTNYDLGMWLVAKGLQNLNPMNTGGTTDLGGFTGVAGARRPFFRRDGRRRLGLSRQSLRRDCQSAR